jgi:hypothetical protein
MYVLIDGIRLNRVKDSRQTSRASTFKVLNPDLIGRLKPPTAAEILIQTASKSPVKSKWLEQGLNCSSGSAIMTMFEV